MQPSLETAEHKETRIDSHTNEYCRGNCLVIFGIFYHAHHHVVISRKEAPDDGEDDDGKA